MILLEELELLIRRVINLKYFDEPEVTLEFRKTLNSQFRNVQSSFESSFMVFKTFYERSKDN
ncbi:hypothetical protein FHR85_001999 [Alkalibacillus almallahensis]|nr:hypothetical protein [Alkalibacillus almallahensis]